MSRLFPPAHAAIDFYAACGKWSPLGDDGKPSVWTLYYALPEISTAINLVANGYTDLCASAEATLEGGLEPSMKNALSKVRTHLVHACTAAQDLKPTFVKAYADDFARANVRGGASRNV